MGPPLLCTYPTHVSLIYTSWRVLSNYFQTSRGFSLFLSHHVGSASSHRGDQIPLLYYTHLCYVMLHVTVLSYWVMGYCMILYFHIKLESFRVTYYPLDRMLRYWLFNLNRASRTFARNRTLKCNLKAFILHWRYIALLSMLLPTPCGMTFLFWLSTML